MLEGKSNMGMSAGSSDGHELATMFSNSMLLKGIGLVEVVVPSAVLVVVVVVAVEKGPTGRRL